MPIIGNAYIAVHAITTGFQNDVNRSLSGLNSQFSQSGNQSGSAFSNGLRRGSRNLSEFQREARKANDAFFAMVTTGYAIGPAISVAVGALSSLVSGFVALTAQVGAAIPSLIVLPSILSAIGQAALVAKAAFSGIGQALKQMTKTGGGGGGGAAAEEARRKRVEAAEKNLARVLETNRENLARANRNLTDAEKRLTDARKEAAESLQQLNFDAEDAAISEKKAAIQLEKARETLARVQDLPPNSRARREAELAYAEADLNLRRAKDRNQDLAKATEEANKKGVEGSEEVVRASRDLQDAKEELARSERDALRSQTDAEEALADAKKKADAGGGASATAAFDKLSDAAKEFVKYLISIKPKLEELKKAAAEALLPPLQLAIQNLVDNLFPRLIPIIEATGGALGKAAIDFSKFVTEGRNLDKLDTVAATNVDTIGKLGIVVGNLYDSLLSLLAAADPLVRRFSDWIVTLTTGWQETLNAKLATGELTDVFNKAGDVAAQLGTIFHNIWGALMNIGKAAAGPGSGGQMLLDMFENSTKKFEEFTKKLLDNGRLEEFFRNTAENAGKISSLIVNIVKEFLKLGENPAIGKTADVLKTSFLPVLSNILNTLQGGAPALSIFIGKLGEFLLKFTETHSINAFFGTLSKGLDVLNAIFGNETVQKILLVIAPIMGTVKALTLMQKVGSFAVKAFAGYFVKLNGIIQSVWGSLGQIGALLGGGAGTGVLVVAGIAAVAAAIYMMWQNSEKFREAIKDLVTAVWGTLKEAFKSIKDTLDGVFKSFGGASGAADGLSKMFKILGDVVATYVIPFIKTYLITSINAVVSAIKIFINVVAAIIKVFQAVWEFVQGIFSLLKGDMTGVKEHFGAAFAAIGDAFMFVFKAIGEFFSMIWDAIVGGIKSAWELTIKPIWDLMLTVFTAAWEGISKLFTGIWDGIKTSIDFVWNSVIKPIFEAFGTVFSTVWGGIEKVFNTIWGGIKTAIGGVFGFFSEVFGKVRDFVSTVLTGIVTGIKELPGKIWDLIGSIASAAKGIGQAILDGILAGVKAVGGFVESLGKAIANGVIDAWNWVANKINDFVPNSLGWGPFSLDLPDNPIPRFDKLAKGGIVPATPGGHLALIAEAGRSERVEPLDPDGLSRRDKAMIQMLAGPATGKEVVVNVYPSKGMDEAELASMVSRQLAFQLRKGAA